MFFDKYCEPDLTPIRITILYDAQLQTLTGTSHDSAMASRGCPFGSILRCLLTDFPEIYERFPPGVLGFTLNGKPPKFFEPLKDGDVIHFLACNESPFILQ